MKRDRIDSLIVRCSECAALAASLIAKNKAIAPELAEISLALSHACEAVTQNAMEDDDIEEAKTCLHQRGEIYVEGVVRDANRAAEVAKFAEIRRVNAEHKRSVEMLSSSVYALEKRNGALANEVLELRAKAAEHKSAMHNLRASLEAIKRVTIEPALEEKRNQ
jgi:hypothetical protein